MARSLYTCVFSPAEAERQSASRQEVQARLTAGNRVTALVGSAPFLLGLGVLVAFIVFLALYFLRKLFGGSTAMQECDSNCANTIWYLTPLTVGKFPSVNLGNLTPLNPRRRPRKSP